MEIGLIGGLVGRFEGVYSDLGRGFIGLGERKEERSGGASLSRVYLTWVWHFEGVALVYVACCEAFFEPRGALGGGAVGEGIATT